MWSPRQLFSLIKRRVRVSSAKQSNVEEERRLTLTMRVTLQPPLLHPVLVARLYHAEQLEPPMSTSSDPQGE